MPVDLITIMDFEDGKLSEEEIAAMLGEMLSSGEIKIHPDKFEKLAKVYIRRGLITADGEVLV
jgi:Ca2+-binding EF-hand superfamily protein